MTDSKRPKLSACLIVGDAHLSVLARCLGTILNAPGGPAADEIVIGFNGQDLPTFTDTIAKALVKDWGLLEVEYLNALNSGEPITYGPVRLVLHRYTWTGDFAAARNDNFSHSTGEWAYYIDCDDLLVGPDHPAYADSMEQDPPAGSVESYPVKGSLVDFFAALPPHVNVVRAPYNFVNSDKGRPIIRKRRPRAVRWSEGHFVWTSEVHEVLVSAIGREIAVWAPGFLLVHDPILRAEERSERNTKILQKQIERLKTEKQAIPGSLLYSQAVEEMSGQNFEAAAARFEAAANTPGTTSEDRAYYYLLAGRALIEGGDYVKAGRTALSVIEAAPNRPEGYLLASEACFRLFQFERCLEWYEASKGKRAPTAGPMVDDRFERCLRPVNFAGIAYLRTGRFQEAYDLADAALKEATFPVALRVKADAEAGLRRQEIAAAGTKLLNGLLDAGFAGTAQLILSKLKPFGLFIEQQKRVDLAFAVSPREIPADSPLGGWLSAANHTIRAPIDCEPDVAAVVSDLVERASIGDRVRVAVTDPSDVTAPRAEAVDGEQLLAACEPHGLVDTLALTDGHLAVSFMVSTHSKRAPARVPDVTIFCPVFAEPWGPWRILKDGTGGSEESVVYLARELQERGLNVDVYAPLDGTRYRGVHIEGGVRWRHINNFDGVKRITGASIAHRSPWSIRFPCFDPKRLFVWHQDAAYPYGWNAAIATQVSNLWVSKWQRRELLRIAGVSSDAPEAMVDFSGAVVGNGIPDSALAAEFPESRDPFSCVYISSPVRGLTQLLGVWPFIRQSFPNATLRVYYGWETARLLPGVATVQAQVAEQLRRTPGVEDVGRLPQFALEQDLVKHSVWLYPLNGFPEAFCVAGVRAAAAGLAPVYRRIAAMEEVQYPSPFSVPDSKWDDDGAAEFVDAALRALDAAGKNALPRQEYRNWAHKHRWSFVAEAVIAEMKRRGALS